MELHHDCYPAGDESLAGCGRLIPGSEVNLSATPAARDTRPCVCGQPSRYSHNSSWCIADGGSGTFEPPAFEDVHYCTRCESFIWREPTHAGPDAGCTRD